jgi:hypothetical protein
MNAQPPPGVAVAPPQCITPTPNTTNIALSTNWVVFILITIIANSEPATQGCKSAWF